MASRCRFHIGGYGVALAALLLPPQSVLAADAAPALRRSDQLDVRRLGQVSEDERAVLRIEWRAGLAGVEETRSVEDMLAKLRRLETGIRDVNQLVRNMPAQASVRAAASVPATPVAADPAESDGHDLRLAVANIAALALVALWWLRRRKTAGVTPANTAALPEQAPRAAALRSGAGPALAPEAVARPPEMQSAATLAPQAAPEPVATSDEASRPSASETVVPASSAEATAATTTDTKPAETRPDMEFSPDATMILDFSLEEAEPEVVARETAKLEALRPAKVPEPPPTEHKADVEPTLQLAEIMLSMGLEQGAAQALIEYTEAHPRHAIYHWLKLLGIYRSRGLKQEFAATAEKLRMYFNIQAAEWGTPVSSEIPTLENFSRVAEHVQEIWSQAEECTSYLRRLLEDNRDGARAGFPQSVAEEILLLVEIQKQLGGLDQPGG